jgi:L-asparaginase
MRAAVVGATLILTVFGGPGLAGCAVLSRTVPETTATPAAHTTATSPQGAVLPKVRLVATGGTISNRTGGRLTAEELVNSMPGIERYVRPEFEQFANIASGSLTVKQWIDLANRINTLFTDDPDLAGVVVTSGTDTLEETAYFLDLTVHTDKPVVIVGSMRNPSTLGYEGAANLLEGYRVAGDPASRGKGVLVVMNEEINGARDVTKSNTYRVEAFRSGELGYLGYVDSDEVTFYRASTKRHTARSEFDVSTLGSLPKVEILYAYAEPGVDMVKALGAGGARGIVIAGTGAGGMSDPERAAIKALGPPETRPVIVRSNRTGNGRVIPRKEYDSEHMVPADNLNPQKARILLMLALTRTRDLAEIRRMFREY